MMPMPTPFDGYVEKPARVSSTCLITAQRNRYSVPCELAGQMVSTRLYPTRVCVMAGDVLVTDHDRIVDRKQVRYDWQHYIPLLERKPGALRNGAPFADMPPPLQRLKQGLMRHAGGDRVMAQVLAAVPTAGLPAVLVAVELGIESGVLSAEHVENVLARLNAAPEAVRAHQCCHHHQPEFRGMVGRVRRRQDDHGAAGSAAPASKVAERAISFGHDVAFRQQTKSKNVREMTRIGFVTAMLKTVILFDRRGVGQVQ
jgi:hypothetical protein